MTGRRRHAVIALLAFALIGWTYTAWWMLEHKGTARRALVLTFGLLRLDGFGPTPRNPTFLGPDAKRTQRPIQLVKVAEGFHQPTNIQFVPGERDLMLVLEKTGRCSWMDLDASTRGVLFEINVNDDGEMGLLGLTFHPQFEQNQKLYVHSNAKTNDTYVSRISEWRARFNDEGELTDAQQLRLVLEVEQPYSNHKGGHLAFGPDGFLYIGLGDGGDQNDPQRNGQKLSTLLGKMLRVDVDHAERGQSYAIPADNPFVGVPNARPEIWAYGLRNPYRYTFDARGRLVVSDIGQEKWEELSFVKAGDNLGWSVREGNECFRAEPAGACDNAAMKAPFYAYGRDDGNAIIGGHIYGASDFPELRGKYVFADSVRGRFWAITLPDDERATIRATDALALGGFPILVSSLGVDRSGHIYVAQLGLTKNSGVIYRIARP